MLTGKDYCDYDTCVALKELGITDCSLQYYEKGCPNTLHRNLFQPLTIRTAEALGRVLAISLYNAHKWLREEKNLHIEVNLQFINDEKRWYWGYTIIYIDNPDIVTIGGDFPSYEATLSEGIKEAVKLLKEK